MYDQIREDIFFILLYGVVTTMAAMASCYLLFRQGNAFAADIKTPARLRKWTGVFFAVSALGHLWYLPILFLTSSKAIKISYACAMLDILLFFPLAIVVMLTMLQDRRRPLWPIGAAVLPPAIGMVWCLVSGSEAVVPAIYAYLLLLGILLILYMLRALRQYRRWLLDNYADLEHKEVWQSFVVVVFILSLLGFYTFGDGGLAYEYIVQISGGVLICYLLWRVETLSDLSISQSLSSLEDLKDFNRQGLGLSPMDDSTLNHSTSPPDNIGSLLQQNCIDTQLYLQHDLTVIQLAKVIGTNRLYLSQYFSSQGMTYNTYINNLRISHFVRLYREAVATQRNFTVKQLAYDSGYRSYSTFSLAFKQRMGLSVTVWINDSDK